MLSGLHVLLLCLLLAAPTLSAQTKESEVKVDPQEFVRQAKPLYYSLIDKGIVSFTCEVKVRWDTAPAVFLIPAQIADREKLENTQLTLRVSARGKVEVNHTYPSGTSSIAIKVFDPLFNVITGIVQGSFQTWTTKGLSGPIPKAGALESVQKSESGYRARVLGPGQGVDLITSPDFQLQRAIDHNPNNDIDEKISFAPSPEGLLFVAADTENKAADSWKHIRTEYDYQTVDGFHLPHNVHVVVDSNIDAYFALESCVIQHGVVITVAAPAK